MDRLVVRIQPPNLASNLLAQLDARSRMLSLTSPVPAEWPFGLDLSARVLMDFTADWQLANLDLLIPPAQWERREIELPQTRAPGSLALNAMPLQRSSYSLPVSAVSPRDGELMLSWGPAAPASQVTLSNQVSALLAGSLWVGLYVRDF